MRARIALLGHPLFTGAVALLAVNDHLLKGLPPGWFTGKASDFAGVFIVAVLAAVVIGHARPALLVTGASFVAIKVSASAASLASPILGGTTRQDPTDLVALLALWPALVFLRFKNVPAGAALPRLLMGSAGFAIALGSITATSCIEPHVVHAFTSEGDVLYAQIPRDPYSDREPLREVRWASSADGGRSWQESDDPPEQSVEPETEDCLDSGTCFRVIRGKRVEIQRGDQWTTSFSFSDEDTARMKLRTQGCGEVPPRDDLFRSLVAVDVSGEEHVVVAMGTQGTLHLGPDATWQRVAVLELEPEAVHGPRWLEYGRIAPLYLILASPLMALLGLLLRRRSEGFWAMGFSFFMGVSLAFVFGVFAFGGNDDYAISGPVLGALTSAVFVFSCLTVIRGWDMRGKWRNRGRPPIDVENHPGR